MDVFDRALVRLHRERAAAGFRDYDFLFREIEERLLERLETVTRRFPRVLVLGARGLRRDHGLRERIGAEMVVCVDTARALLDRDDALPVIADPEFLPFGTAGFDLVLSCLELHWINDLPGLLLQVRAALKPDGLFLAAMLGGESLRELRHALLQAELEATGGTSPRVSPTADLRDAAGLLQRAGFALPVADADTITVTYADALALMRDLRGMGETNAVAGLRRGFTGRATLAGAAATYATAFAEADGRVPATFQVLYLTGWAPHPSQQQPLRPGAAEHRLADALGTTEQSAGDPAGPR